MQHVTLGSTGIKVSRLAFGNMPFGSQVDLPEGRRIIHRCLDAGINFFDTADMYNRGKAESMLGEILGSRRESIILASKVRIRVGDGVNQEGLSRYWIMREVDASLRRLRTDRLDLYYMHQPDPATPIEETLSTMNDLVRAGKVLHFGVSNYAAWQIARILWLCERNGWSAPAVVQPMHNLVARRIETELLPFCREFGLGVFTYNPLAGGLLTGKHTLKEDPKVGTRFHKNEIYLRRYWHPEMFRAVESLSKIAAEAGRSLVDLSIQWCLRHQDVHGIILGATSEAQLEENLKAAEGELDPGILEACDRVWSELSGPVPKYNR
jgi:aryl-alcohol dehydrogenase-like predicted oxidoreductase